MLVGPSAEAARCVHHDLSIQNNAVTENVKLGYGSIVITALNASVRTVTSHLSQAAPTHVSCPPISAREHTNGKSAGVAAAAGEGAAGAESTRGRGKLSTLERDGRGGAGRDGGVSVSRSRSSPAMGIGSGGGGLAVPGEAASRQRNGMHRLTMQACFKEEREAFIRDLQARK